MSDVRVHGDRRAAVAAEVHRGAGRVLKVARVGEALDYDGVVKRYEF